MPPQDYVMKVLYLVFVVFVAYIGNGEAVSLKNNELSRNSPKVNEANVQDGLTRELGALPNMAKRVPQENKEKLPERKIPQQKVGYDKATMLFVKRYVDALRSRSGNTYEQPQKKSIYGPGMYPFYGMYGKRAREDPRFGYNLEVLDMIHGLIERTEAAAMRNRKAEEMAKEFAETEDALDKGKAIKANDNQDMEKSAESKELSEVLPPKVTSTDMEDKAAKVTAFEADADEKTLEAMRDPVVHHGH